MIHKEAAARSIDEYISRFPAAVRPTLARVRRAIRAAVPGAHETISYGMPTFKVNGRAVVYFSGWKQHYSIYPSTGRLIEHFKQELHAYDYNDKGTIRFPLDEPVPEKLIAGIARFLAREAAGPDTKPARTSPTRKGKPRAKASGATV